MVDRAGQKITFDMLAEALSSGADNEDSLRQLDSPSKEPRITFDMLAEALPQNTVTVAPGTQVDDPSQKTDPFYKAYPKAIIGAGANVLQGASGIAQNIGETPELKRQEIKDAIATLLRDGAPEPLPESKPAEHDTQDYGLIDKVLTQVGKGVKAGGKAVRWVRETEPAKATAVWSAKQRLKRALAPTDIGLEGKSVVLEPEVSPEIAALLKKGDNDSLQTAYQMLEENEVEAKEQDNILYKGLASAGKKSGEFFGDVSKKITPKTERGSLLYYGTSAVQGVLPSLGMGVAATVLTKNPSLGYGLMFGQVAGQTYNEEREAGRTTTQAAEKGFFNGITEVLSEGVPLGILTKEGGKLIPRLGKASTAEGIQEFINEAVQIGYDEGVLGKDTPPEEIGQRLWDAGIIGAIGGAGAAGAVHPFVSGQEKAEKLKKDVTDSIVENLRKGGKEREDALSAIENGLTEGFLSEEDVDKIKKDAAQEPEANTKNQEFIDNIKADFASGELTMDELKESLNSPEVEQLGIIDELTNLINTLESSAQPIEAQEEPLEETTLAQEQALWKERAKKLEDAARKRAQVKANQEAGILTEKPQEETALSIEQKEAKKQFNLRIGKKIIDTEETLENVEKRIEYYSDRIDEERRKGNLRNQEVIEKYQKAIDEDVQRQWRLVESLKNLKKEKYKVKTKPDNQGLRKEDIDDAIADSNTEQEIAPEQPNLSTEAIAEETKPDGQGIKIEDLAEALVASEANEDVAGEPLTGKEQRLAKVGEKQEPLIEEAKKYKTADEFVEAQKKDRITTLQKKIDEIERINTKDISPKMGEAKIKQQAQLEKKIRNIRTGETTITGEDGKEYIVEDDKLASQLTDIWNKANAQPLTGKDRLLAKVETKKYKTYEEAQKAIDDFETNLENQGLSHEEIMKHPELDKLYDERNKLGQKDLELSYKEISNSVKEFIDSEQTKKILKNVYSLDPESKTGQYFAAEYTKKAVADRKDTRRKLFNYFKEEYGKKHNLDMDGIFTNISGLTRKGQENLLKELTDKAAKVESAIYEYFNGVKQQPEPLTGKDRLLAKVEENKQIKKKEVDSAENDGYNKSTPTTPPDRRKNSDERERVRQLIRDGKIEEIEHILYTDSLTGLKNKRGWETTDRKPVQVMADADGLKWVNDNAGYAFGDVVLGHIGNAVREATDTGARVSGDEFRFEAETVEEAEAISAKIDKYLDSNPFEIVMPDGEIQQYRGRVSHGIGKSEKAAEGSLKVNKARRKATGESTERGAEPERYAPERLAGEVRSTGGEAVSGGETARGDKTENTTSQSGKGQILAKVAQKQETKPVEATGKEKILAKVKGKKQSKPEAKIEIETTAKGKKVSVDITKKEADDLTFKQQKEYLINEIDVAIKNAKSGELKKPWNDTSEALEEALEANKEKFGKVVIEVPGDGKFTLINNKQNLENFKKEVGKLSPRAAIDTHKKRSLISISAKPPNKRLTGKGLQYYNPYKPKKQGLVENKERQFWRDGFFSDGAYLIKLNDKPKLKYPIVEGDKAPDIKGLISGYTDAKLTSAKIAGMFYDGDLELEDNVVLVDVVSSDETIHTFPNVKYIDSVTTQYPKAKVFINRDNKAVVFKEGNKIVAVVMPRIDEDNSLDKFATSGYNRLYGDKAKADATGTPEAEVLNYTQFAKKHGYVSDYDITDHGTLSPSGRERISKNQKQQWDKDLLDRIESNKNGHEAYREAILKGTVVDPDGVITKESIGKTLSDKKIKQLKSEIEVAKSGIKYIEGLGEMSHTKNGNLKKGYQRTVDDYQRKIDEAEATLSEVPKPQDMGAKADVVKQNMGVKYGSKQQPEEGSVEESQRQISRTGRKNDSTKREDGTRYPSVISDRAGSYVSGVTHIESPRDAAAFAHLNLSKYAQEHLSAIILDKNKKIILVHRYSIGTPYSSVATSSLIAGHALNTPGAKSLVFIHNHPGGNSALSPEDERVLSSIQNLLEGTGVEASDIIAVGNGKYSSSVEGGKTVTPIPDIKATHKIPVVERIFKTKGENLQKVSFPADAIEAAKEALPSGGLLLLNKQNEIVGAVAADDYSFLREGMSRDILKQVEASNASGIIAYSPDVITSNQASNLKSFANAASMGLLDVIDNDGSLVEKGSLPDTVSQKFFSTQKPTKPQDTITKADLKKIFSGMQNITTGVNLKGNFTFRVGDKKAVEILEVDHINGYINTSSGRIPVGSFLKNTIELKTGGENVKADVSTVFHEFTHYLETNGIINNNDVKALNVAIARSKGISERKVTEEDRADYVGNNLADWQKLKNFKVKMVLKKIADFMNAVYEFVSRTRTARGVLRDVESGKISQKETGITWKERIQKAFPKSIINPTTITFTDRKTQGFTVTLPNKKTLVIDPTREFIQFDEKSVSQDYEKKIGKNDKALGKWREADSLMELLKDADDGTLTHEQFHVLMSMVYTEPQIDAILKRYGNEEKAAEAFRRKKTGARGLFDAADIIVDKVIGIFKPSVFPDAMYQIVEETQAKQFSTKPDTKKLTAAQKVLASARKTEKSKLDIAPSVTAKEGAKKWSDLWETKAYPVIRDKYDSVLKAVAQAMPEKVRRGFSEHGVSPEVKQAGRMASRKINELVQEGIKHVENIKTNVPEDQRELLYKVLDGRALPGRLAKISEPIRKDIIDWGKRLVDTEVLAPETYKKGLGTYLHRTIAKYESSHPIQSWLYKKHKLFESQFKHRGHPPKQVAHSEVDKWLSGEKEEGIKWEILDVGKEKTTIWRDWTEKEREAHGEIMDAAHAVARTFEAMAKSVGYGEFFSELADNKDIVKDEWEPGMVQIPNSRITKGGTYKFGKLHGKYVSEGDYDYIMSTANAADPVFWKPLVDFWKKNKTYRNPGTHMNNTLQNIMWADFKDVPFKTILKAISEYKKGGVLFKEAEALDVFGHDVVTQDLRDAVEISAKETQKEGIGGIVDWTINHLMKVDDFAKRAYQAEDGVFRLALYMDRVSKGVPKEAAADEAIEAFIDYEINAPWVKKLRDTGVVPFISWPYKALPLMIDNAMRKPLKMAKWATIFYAANMIGQAIAGGDEDKERALLPEHMKGWSLFGPTAVKLPFKGKGGHSLYLDISRKIPFGDIFSLNLTQVGPFGFGGPVFMPFEMWLNKQAYTDKEIVTRGVDTVAEQLGKYAEYVWRGVMPNIPGLPYSYATSNILASAQSREDWLGRDQGVFGAALGGVGLKATPVNVEKQLYWKQKDYERDIRNLKSKISSAKYRQTATPESIKDAEDKYNKRIISRTIDWIAFLQDINARQPDSAIPEELKPTFVDEELRKLEQPSKDELKQGIKPLSIAPPSRHLIIRGESVELSQEQHDKYIDDAAARARKILSWKMKTSLWKNANRDKKEDIVKDVVLQSRSIVRKKLKTNFKRGG